MKKIITLIALCTPLMAFAGAGRDIQQQMNELYVEYHKKETTDERKLEIRHSLNAYLHCISIVSENDCY